MTAPESSSSGTEEAAFLEDNIATVAHHLGQPGARMSVSYEGGSKLIVDPGEVLKEISRRLGVAQSVPEPFDVMATIYPDYAESFERETCPLCDHIDGTTTPPAQADVREAIPGAEALAARLREAAYFCTDLARLEEHCRAVADELDCAALQPQAGNAAVSSTNHSGEA